MKNIFLVVSLCLSLSIVAQKEINEGIITFKQTMSSDNEQMNAQLQMVGDMMTTTYFKENKSRTELSNPMTGDVISIFDTESNQMFMSMNSPMAGKVYTLDTMPGSEDLPQGVSIVKGAESRTILGYDCTQYNIAFTQDGVQMTMELFVTPDIKALNKEALQYLGDFDGGFPLYVKMETTMSAFGITMIQEATDLKSEKVDDTKFDMTPPEGYQKVTTIPGM